MKNFLQKLRGNFSLHPITRDMRLRGISFLLFFTKKEALLGGAHTFFGAIIFFQSLLKHRVNQQTHLAQKL